MAPSATSAPFTQAVVAAMRSLYPEALADRSFDNTGLLLEAPYNASRRQRNSVLLTIDLTKAVADEAIRRKDSCIVAYHPIIFRGLKSLTLEHTQQQSLLRLASEGISVYCPHTAVDAAPEGLGDWLADIISSEPGKLQADQSSSTDLQFQPASMSQGAVKLGAAKHDRYPIKKVSGNGVHGAGMGRVIRLEQAVPLKEMLKRIAVALGGPRGFPVAIPQDKTIDDITIKSAAVCAGSGGHLFAELEKDEDDTDLYFTGELSHHEALAAIEKGKCVVSVFHSNSERGFLHAVMKPKLEQAIEEEWTKIRGDKDEPPEDADAMVDDGFEVAISQVDRDPYGIMYF